MLLTLIAAGAATVAGGVCWKGIPTAEGQGPGGRWRVRFACTRYILEMMALGRSNWSRLGTYGLTELKKAKQTGVAMVILPPSTMRKAAGSI